jgi:GH25 family lysozyme M1 (1,4-beta-N-acetylmuramidase)
MAPFPPSTTDTRPFGVDISRYNGVVDFDMMRAYDYVPVEYIMIRSGQGASWSYDALDSRFYYNWENAKGIPRMCYHVIYPSVSVIPQVDNVERIFEEVDFDFGEGPLWIDLELWQGQTPQVVNDRTQEFQWRLEERFNIKVGIYSGWWFLSQLPHASWWNDVDWWLAQYLNANLEREHPGPPAHGSIPIENVKFHQTTSWIEGAPMGAPGNVRIDGNRFMGGNLYEYLNVEEPPVTSPWPGWWATPRIEP